MEIKNNRLIVSTKLKKMLSKIVINNFSINYSFQKRHFGEELVFEPEEIFPSNTFIEIKFYDEHDHLLDIDLKKNGIFPFSYTVDQAGVLVKIYNKILLKFVDTNCVFNNKNGYELSKPKHFRLDEKQSIQLGESKNIANNHLHNLLAIAIQKEIKIVHLIPIVIEDGCLFFPNEYLTGLFDLELVIVRNNNIFKFASIDVPKVIKEVALEKLSYNIEKISDTSFSLHFSSEIDTIKKAYIITDDCLFSGSIDKDKFMIVFNDIKIGNVKKVKLVMQVDYKVLTDDLREKSKMYELGILLDYVDLRKYKISKEIVKNAQKLNVTNISIDKTVLSFDLIDSSEYDLNLNPLLLLQERKTNNIYYISGNRRYNTLYFNFRNFLDQTDSKGVKRWNLFLLYDANGLVSYQLGCFDADFNEKPNKFFNIFKQEFENNSTYNHRSRIYLAAKNELSLVKNNLSNLIREQYSIKTEIDKFSMKKNVVRLRINLQTPYSEYLNIGDVHLIYRNKDKLDDRKYTVEKVQKYNKGIYIYCTVDLLEKGFYPLYWDVYIGLIKNSKEYYVKVSKVSQEVYHDVDNTISKYQFKVNNEEIIYPYITLSKDLSFTYRKKEYFENRYYLFKENIAFYVAMLFRKHLSKKDIWIAFEKLAMSAHDSGYYFFDYVYKNNKHDNFYYVIRKDSPEIVNLEDKKDRIIYFMSFKYFVYMFAAKLLISSDTKRNSYNLKLKKSKLAKALTDKKLVYLQHGVNGLKVVRDFYKDRGVFDLVIAPSEYERKMIINYWGYDRSEVVTTGLARWDGLEDKSDQINYKQIFLMPTWRTWMDGMTRQQFIESEYYKKYNEFLSSEKLHKLLEENNIKIKFFLHPKFKDYIDLFTINSNHIEKFGFLEVPLDEMIMKSSLMISDYSSVIWEMFYLKKPCVFFHFDRDKYLEYEGTYMDLDKDLFGDVAFDTVNLINIVESYINNDFREKEEFGNLRNTYFTYMDHNNSERIYDAIQENKKNLYQKSKKKRIKLSHIIPFKWRRKILNFKDRLIS
ncbi:CDP-glycerol glycerophosphotransferase family protein [Oceanobacillus halophilus]|uniref:CDP-glycerol glycerophosphotransferase family protein n=1 Tax=Oceanobacillus halophilus TaxID=930130 RepID=UPI001314D4B1|nr:CDP-glycerol glycerophosphotransferase family protein [Oceanobacillus halophilus]